MTGDIILAFSLRLLLFIGCNVTILYQINNLKQLLQSANDLKYFVEDSRTVTYIITVAIGGTVVLAAIGAHGAFKRPKFLNIFAVFMFLFAIVVFVAPLHWHLEAMQLVEEMRDSAMSGDYWGDGKAWDSFQRENHCCGLRGWKDWKKLGWTNEKFLPHSCCKKASEADIFCFNKSPHLYATGCASQFSSLPLAFFEPVCYLALSALSMLIYLKCSQNEDQPLKKMISLPTMKPNLQHSNYVDGKFVPNYIIPMPWYDIPAQKGAPPTV